MMKIALIEDETLIREGLKLAVDWGKYDCEVVGEAADGEEGETLIRVTHPDIVITDIRMPKKNGLEMVAALQGDISCEYIVLSGYDDFTYAKKAINLGVKGYLLKPIDDKELEEILLNTIAIVKNKRVILKHISSCGIEKNEQLKNGLCDKYIREAYDVIKQRYMEDLTLKIVADELFISESYLGKLFKNKTAYTFLDILTLYRIKAAVDLLEKSNQKVYEIAYAVGYSDSRYFSKVFQKIVGIKPTAYRNGYQLSSDNVLNMIM